MLTLLEGERTQDQIIMQFSPSLCYFNSEKQREKASILNTLSPKTHHRIPAVFGPCSSFHFCRCQSRHDQRQLGRKGSISSHLYNLPPIGTGQELKTWVWRKNQWRDAAVGSPCLACSAAFLTQPRPSCPAVAAPTQSTLFPGDSRFVSHWQLTLTVTWNNHCLHSSSNLEKFVQAYYIPRHGPQSPFIL